MRKFQMLKNLKCRLLSSKPPLRPRGVDLKQKVVYGGDLLESASTKSFGSILFNRLTECERENEVIQICVNTGHEMTTRDYVRRSVAFARRLQEEGIKKGDFIVLVGNNSLNLNTALLGIFFIGAVPVAIAHKSSLDEFKIIIEYVKPKLFGCDRMHLFSFRRIINESIENQPYSVFLLSQQKDSAAPEIESFEEFIRGRDEDFNSFVPAEVDDPEEDLALVTKALTDSMTGWAVGITHKNLNSVIARFDAKPLETLRKHNFLMVQKVTWMSGLYSLIISCCFGSKLIVMNEFNEEVFMKSVEKYKVTTSFLFSPKIWQLYKYHYQGNYDVSSCKNIYAVDGFLPKSLVDGMKEKTGITLKSSYAVGELTGLVLEGHQMMKEGSVGRLVEELYGKVISSHNYQNLGPNLKGELCFKGPTLTKGYINDPKATRELFDKEGFFMSGQYGYYDDDGDFFIIDKINYAITYKAMQVSPRELEGIIKSLESVKDVAVAGIPHPTDGHYLIAFVVPQRGHKISSDDIHKHVNENVTDYKKLRGGVVFVTKIPRSRESGAIKRHIFQKIMSKYLVKTEIPSEALSDTRESSGVK